MCDNNIIVPGLVPVKRFYRIVITIELEVYRLTSYLVCLWLNTHFFGGFSTKSHNLYVVGNKHSTSIALLT
jgi:hypothetical protein